MHEGHDPRYSYHIRTPWGHLCRGPGAAAHQAAAELLLADQAIICIIMLESSVYSRVLFGRCFSDIIKDDVNC